jgi:hypothetical protein
VLGVLRADWRLWILVLARAVLWSWWSADRSSVFFVCGMGCWRTGASAPSWKRRAAGERQRPEASPAPHRHRANGAASHQWHARPRSASVVGVGDLAGTEDTAALGGVAACSPST